MASTRIRVYLLCIWRR